MKQRSEDNKTFPQVTELRKCEDIFHRFRVCTSDKAIWKLISVSMSSMSKEY